MSWMFNASWTTFAYISRAAAACKDGLFIKTDLTISLTCD